MQRRKWFQVPHAVRRPPATNACRRRERWATYPRLFDAVPARFCAAIVQEVRSWVLLSLALNGWTEELTISLT